MTAKDLRLEDIGIQVMGYGQPRRIPTEHARQQAYCGSYCGSGCEEVCYIDCYTSCSYDCSVSCYGDLELLNEEVYTTYSGARSDMSSSDYSMNYNMAVE